MRRMTMRIFLLVVGLLTLWPAAHAQQKQTLPRIAFLTSTSPESSPTADAFRQGLRDLGYVEDQNIIVEWRWSRGKSELFPEFVAEMVRLKVDVIVVANVLAGRVAHQATKTIPIVFSSGMGDGVASGFIESLARPGGNITGLSSQSPDLVGKRLETLKAAVANLSRMVVLGDPRDPSYLPERREMELAATALGVQIHSYLEVSTPQELAAALANIPQNAESAIFTLTGTLLFAERANLAQYAIKSPMICFDPSMVAAGCLVSYSSDYSDLNRRAATYVDRILKGAKPADLPVEQPTKFKLVINLKTAKALGLEIPPMLLARADEVIE